MATNNPTPIQVGRNISAIITGNENGHRGTLHLMIDMDAVGKTSASGKSIVIASTEGNVSVTLDAKLGLNLYIKA